MGGIFIRAAGAASRDSSARATAPSDWNICFGGERVRGRKKAAGACPPEE